MTPLNPTKPAPQPERAKTAKRNPAVRNHQEMTITPEDELPMPRTRQQSLRVPFGTTVPRELRARIDDFVIVHRTYLQDVVTDALDEYLERRGGMTTYAQAVPHELVRYAPVTRACTGLLGE